ncbi:MAG: hypothetical protein JSS90_03310 [Bacteroidetes bacterium]|jgi:hypothetical protein|nr:hypothetical protein [Bacteroidota bacterium]
MKRMFKLTGITLAIIVLTTSCKKKSKDCVAGTGGTNSMMVYLKHHSKLITSLPEHADTLFIKYNSNDLPGENISDFDTYYVGDTLTDHFMIDGLNCGNYYLFGAAWDTSITQRVKGGIPVTIDENAGQVMVNIPVTEVH